MAAPIDYGLTSLHLPQLAITAKPDFFITSSGVRAVELNISSGIGGFFSLFSKIDFYTQNEVVISAMEAAGLKIVGNGPRQVFDDIVSAFPRPFLLISPDCPTNDAGRAYLEREIALYSRVDSETLEIGKLCETDFLDLRSRFACIYKIASDHTILKSTPTSIRRIEEGNLASMDVRSRTLDHLYDTKMNLALLWQDELWGSARIPTELRKNIAPTYTIDQHANFGRPHTSMVFKKADSLAGQHILFGTDVDSEQLPALASRLRGTDWITQERLTSMAFPNVFLLGNQFIRIDVPVLFRAFFLAGYSVGTDALCGVFDETCSELLSPPGVGALGGGVLLPVERC